MPKSRDGRELERIPRGNIPGRARPVGNRHPVTKASRQITETIHFSGADWRFRSLWPRMVIRGMAIHIDSVEPVKLRLEAAVDGEFVSSLPLSDGLNEMGLPAAVDIHQNTVIDLKVVGDGDYTVEGMMIVSWSAD